METVCIECGAWCVEVEPGVWVHSKDMTPATPDREFMEIS